jgi:enamine deaminase RidA (YjgF/YER057c/UK114 family)
MKCTYILLTALILVLLVPSYGQGIDQKLTELGITLPAPTKPVANYVKAVQSGKLVFLAGHVSTRADGTNITGKLGKDLTVEQGYEAAKVATVQLLSTLKAEVGDLNKVKRIVNVTGFVNGTPEFTDQPKVINGCSDLLVAIFGEKGKHARSAVGMASLPLNCAVEIEMIVEVN